MHNPISNDILRTFDAREDKVEFTVEDLPFGSPEREAALKEYLNKLDAIQNDVKDLIFENSDFRCQRPTPIGRGLAARHSRGSNGTNIGSRLPSIRRVRVVDSTRDALDVANAS